MAMTDQPAPEQRQTGEESQLASYREITGDDPSTWRESSSLVAVTAIVLFGLAALVAVLISLDVPFAAVWMAVGLAIAWVIGLVTALHVAPRKRS
jgi:fatty acid desaturase